MLLLSSATRILATERSSGNHTECCGTKMCADTVPLWYWSTEGVGRQRGWSSSVSEVDTGRAQLNNCPVFDRFTDSIQPEAGLPRYDYQGMIFLIPFFFLLVDSLPLPLTGVCAPSAGFAASADCPFAG